MDEVESMWMEMVVFRIDLTNNWMDVHGFDRADDDIILLARNALEDGLTRFGSPDT